MKNGLTLSIEYKLSNYCLKDLSCIGLPLSLLLHTFYVIDTELNGERERERLTSQGNGKRQCAT